MIQALIIFDILYFVVWLLRMGRYYSLVKFSPKPRPWYAERKKVWILFDLCGGVSSVVFWVIVVGFPEASVFIFPILALAFFYIWLRTGPYFTRKLFGDDLTGHDMAWLNLYLLSFHGGLITAVVYKIRSRKK